MCCRESFEDVEIECDSAVLTGFNELDRDPIFAIVAKISGWTR